MKIHFNTLLKASILSSLIYLIIDTTFEHILKKLTGYSFLHFFEQKLQINYDTRFHLLNLILFSAEMFLVMFLYALLKSNFPTGRKPLLITAGFTMAFAGLFLGQMINLGIYPVLPAVIFGISTLIGFPLSLLVGACVYDRIS